MMQANKQILLGTLLAATLFSGSALAALPGWYLGAQIGQSNTNLSASDINGAYGPITLNVGSTNSTGFAGRVYGGYQFTAFQNGYLGAELGYTRLANSSYRNITDQFGNVYPNINVNNLNVWDLAAKGTYCLDGGFGVYLKVGVARMNGSASTTIAPGVVVSESGNVTRPTWGLGLQYDFTPNVVADVFFTRIQKGGNLLNNADFYGVGVAYHFG